MFPCELPKHFAGKCIEKRLEAFKYNYLHPSNLFTGFPTQLVLTFPSPLETWGKKSISWKLGMWPRNTSLLRVRQSNVSLVAYLTHSLNLLRSWWNIDRPLVPVIGPVFEGYTRRTKTSACIIWLAPWTGKMSQIVRCDWLPERARFSYIARSGLPAVSAEKNFPESQIIDPLSAKLFR